MALFIHFQKMGNSQSSGMFEGLLIGITLLVIFVTIICFVAAWCLKKQKMCCWRDPENDEIKGNFWNWGQLYGPPRVLTYEPEPEHYTNRAYGNSVPWAEVNMQGNGGPMPIPYTNQRAIGY